MSDVDWGFPGRGRQEDETEGDAGQSWGGACDPTQRPSLMQGCPEGCGLRLGSTSLPVPSLPGRTHLLHFRATTPAAWKRAHEKKRTLRGNVPYCLGCSSPGIWPVPGWWDQPVGGTRGGDRKKGQAPSPAVRTRRNDQDLPLALPPSPSLLMVL